jgi:ribonuclease HI
MWIVGTDTEKIVELFADGACSGNPGPGGYAAILRYGETTREISGCEPKTTNNRMELRGVIEGLRLLKRPCRVKVITDSNYVVKGMTQWIRGWVARNWTNSEKKPVVNRDLWEELLALSKRHRIAWQWIPGHRGNKSRDPAVPRKRKSMRKGVKGGRRYWSASPMAFLSSPVMSSPTY